jgi:regulation of enolase protein 1 (concanavalin A-like superfamily)
MKDNILVRAIYTFYIFFHIFCSILSAGYTYFLHTLSRICSKLTSGFALSIYSKKANALALVLIVITGLLASSIYIQNIYLAPSVDKTIANALVSQAQTASKASMEYAIVEFMQSGFATNSSLWYCNYPYVPNLSEVSDSIHTIAQENLKTSLSSISQDNSFSYQLPTITFELAPTQEQLTPFLLKAKLDDLLISVNTSDFSQTKSISPSYSYDWSTWRMYQGLLNWMNINAGDLSGHFFDMFNEIPCQAASAKCTCPGANERIIDNDTITAMKISVQNVSDVIFKSVSLLNQSFKNDSQISCSFSIKKFASSQTEHSNYSKGSIANITDGLDTPAKSVLLDREPDFYNYTMADMLYEQYTVSQTACPVYRSNNYSFKTGITQTPGKNQTSGVCTDDTADARIVTEQFSVDRSVAVLFEVTCQDPTILVQSKNEIQPLQAVIQLRFAVQDQCPLPEATNEQGFVCNFGASKKPMCDLECPVCKECRFGEPFVNALGLLDYNMSCVPQELAATCGIKRVVNGQVVFTPSNLPEHACAVCDTVAGTCTIPQTIGSVDVKCTANGDCQVCDGVNTGLSACKTGGVSVLGSNYARQMNMECAGTCGVCNDEGSCQTPAPKLDGTFISSNLCPVCQKCGEISGVATCVANLSANGVEIKNQTCMMCFDGEPAAMSVGTRHSTCKTCEVCTANTVCGYVEELTQKQTGCSECQTCGEVSTNVAGCIANNSKNGLHCGGSICTACSNGACVTDADSVGIQCASDKGCVSTCSAQGTCTDGSSTKGQSCSARLYPCLGEGECNQYGSCLPAQLPSGKKCCGTQQNNSVLCNSGDSCCAYGGTFLDQWVCSACDDITT